MSDIYITCEFLKKVKNKSIKLWFWFCLVWFGLVLGVYWPTFCWLLHAPRYLLACNRDIHPSGFDISGFLKVVCSTNSFLLIIVAMRPILHKKSRINPFADSHLLQPSVLELIFGVPNILIQRWSRWPDDAVLRHTSGQCEYLLK